MVVSNQTIKREKKREKKAAIDRLTNWYMINLAWGILGIVFLRIIESGYNSTDMLLKMPVIMKVFIGVFAIIAIGLFVCGKFLVSKGKTRLYNYSIFSGVLALISAWIGFFPQIKALALSLVPSLDAFLDSRWWFSWGIIVLIVLYLVIALILTSIKIKLIECGKSK